VLSLLSYCDSYSIKSNQNDAPIPTEVNVQSHPQTIQIHLTLKKEISKIRNLRKSTTAFESLILIICGIFAVAATVTWKFMHEKFRGNRFCSLNFRQFVLAACVILHVIKRSSPSRLPDVQLKNQIKLIVIYMTDESLTDMIMTCS
jgi:hypothetical protein